METRSYRTIDKAAWGSGPWNAGSNPEPDKLQWPDAATGLPCLAVRNVLGAWCGYVGLAEGHPWHGLDYADPALAGIEVHGGLTFSGHCQEPANGHDEAHSVCHQPAPGEPAKVYWLGFDTCHLGDAPPLAPPLLVGRHPAAVYRDLAYVQAQCRQLAQQLALPLTEAA